MTYVVEATAKIRIKCNEGSLADLATGTAVTAEVKGKKIVVLHA